MLIINFANREHCLSLQSHIFYPHVQKQPINHICFQSATLILYLLSILFLNIDYWRGSCWLMRRSDTTKKDKTFPAMHTGRERLLGGTVVAHNGRGNLQFGGSLHVWLLSNVCDPKCDWWFWWWRWSDASISLVQFLALISWTRGNLDLTRPIPCSYRCYRE